jgi:NADPH-dependent curcumin reductase CurA
MTSNKNDRYFPERSLALELAKIQAEFPIGEAILGVASGEAVDAHRQAYGAEDPAYGVAGWREAMMAPTTEKVKTVARVKTASTGS